MLGGAALNFAPVNPIKALFWSAVINGVVAVPVMAVMMLMGRNRKIMGEFVLGRIHILAAAFPEATVGLFWCGRLPSS
jgi:Mn2+/Fe2+ NRAMP family transporter